MNILILLITLIILLVFMFLLVLAWLGKNNIEIILHIHDGNTPRTIISRYRVKYDRYYKVNNFSRTPSLPVKHSKMCGSIIQHSSIPLIGIKKSLYLEVYDIDGLKSPIYVPRKIPEHIYDHKITDTMLSWLSTSKSELFDSTKPQQTTADFMKEVVLPMGLIILAVICIIMFPKIYTELNTTFGQAMPAASGKLAETVTKFIPLG